MNTKSKKFFALVCAVVLMASAMGGYTTESVKGETEEIITENISGMPDSTGQISAQELMAEEISVEESLTEKMDVGESTVEKTSTEISTAEETTTEASITEETTTAEPATEEETMSPEEYRLIAHRGYSGYAPENSMPAFEKAIAAGFKTIELDVIRCRPDAGGKATWVISHDNSLKDTMGVDKNITDLTYSQILNYSYTKGNEISSYSNLKIVSFDQILTYIKLCKETGNKVKWQIEIKDVDQEPYTNYFEDELVKPVLENQLEDCVSFSSFNASYLTKIKEVSQNRLRTWFLSTVLDGEALNRAKKAQAQGISFKGTVTTTTKEMIQTALQSGFQLGAYTINSPVVMGVYYQYGVRYFATDKLSPMDVSQTMLTGTYNTKLFTCTLSKSSYTYDGSRKLPKVTVAYRGEDLIEGLNYTLSYENNKNPGTATVYISGINNCTDETSLTYTITMPKVKGFKIDKAKTKKVQMSWNKVDSATGYIVYSYNFTTKKYKILQKIKGNGKTSYSAKKLTPATKYKYRVKAYVEADGKTYKSSPCSAKTVYTRPAKVTITSAKRYKKYKRLRVKWKKSEKCSGYQIKISTDKAMKNIIGSYSVSGSGSTKIKIKKLSKKKTYYVKVRAYLKNGDKKIYSVYSTVKKSKKKSKK